MTKRTIPTILFAGLALVAGLAPTAAASPIFNAPPGCAAIQPAPKGEGVQCFGSNDLDLGFSGTGSGPLWASEVVFEWDFMVSREWGSNGPVIIASVNGESFFRIYDVVHEPTVRYTGSVSIPYTPGAPLTSWEVAVEELWGGTIAGGPVLSATPMVATPLDGLGFRFLANHQPPASAPAPVPEPGTAALTTAALLLVAARGFRPKS